MGYVVQHCDWCGTTECDSWYGAPYPGRYCSWDCMLAGRADRGVISTAIILLILIPVLSISIQAGLIIMIPFLLSLAYTVIGYSKRGTREIDLESLKITS